MKQLIQIQNDKIIRRIPLNHPRYNLGRDAGNDIVFDSPKVSRLHAVLVAGKDDYCIVDQGAKNQVRVNGHPIAKKQLAPGDTINLSGDITLLYIYDCETNEKAGPQPDRQDNVIHAKDLLQLKEVTGRIIALDKLDNILNIILSEVIELVAADRGFIALTDERSQIQTGASVSHNIPLENDDDQKSLFSRSIVQQAIQHKENIFILNTEDNNAPLSDSIFELELRSVMCAPLLFGNKLVGILYVDSGRLVDFSETDRFFFTILADQAAIAIENAQLYGQAQKSNEQLKQEVEEAEARYRQLVEVSPEAIAVHCEGKIVFANPAAVKMMGAATAGELIGQPLTKLVYPADLALIQERVRQELEEHKPAPLQEEKFIRLDGSIIDVEVIGAPMVYRGKPAAQVICWDITARNQMEQ